MGAVFDPGENLTQTRQPDDQDETASDEDEKPGMLRRSDHDFVHPNFLSPISPRQQAVENDAFVAPVEITPENFQAHGAEAYELRSTSEAYRRYSTRMQ